MKSYCEFLWKFHSILKVLDSIEIHQQTAVLWIAICSYLHTYLLTYLLTTEPGSAVPPWMSSH